MKKYFSFLIVAVMLLTSGCNFKVQHNTFYLPQDQVEGVEIQREYTYEDGRSGTYFRHKVLTDAGDIYNICEKIRKFPARRASSAEPHPIVEFSMIIVINGAREHHLILTKDMAFFDQVAYEYTDADIYQDFVNLYNNLNYAEEDTEPSRF